MNNVETSECNSTDTIGNNSDLIETFKLRFSYNLWKNHVFFSDDYIYEINEHWMRFCPPSKEHFYVLAFLYILVMIAGTIGNLVVVILYFRRKSLRTSSNMLILNLAFSDLFMMMMIPIFVYNSWFFGPVLGSVGCKLYGFMGGISGTVSICTLALISLDRCCVIKNPLRSKPFRVKAFLLVIWIYGATFSIIPSLDFGLGSYVPEGYLISCSYDYLTSDHQVRYFILSFFVAAWVVPFCVIVTSYVIILLVVAKTSNFVKNDPHSRESRRFSKRDEKIKQEVKLAVVALSLILLWFVAWTPYATVSLLGIGGKKEWITPLGSMVPALFCKTASCVDPYVYALSHPRFRAELMSLLGRRRAPSGISRVGKESSYLSETTTSQTEASTSSHRPVAQKFSIETVASVDVAGEKEMGDVSHRPPWWFKASFRNKSATHSVMRFANRLSLRRNED